MARTAEEISVSDLARRIDLDGPDDELRQLADTLDRMLERLQEAFETQRDLVGDAPHELRNPLATIRANVDAILAHHDVSPAERAASAAAVERATTRMTRLVEDLLASARRHSPAFDETAFDLAGLVSEVTDEYAVLAEQRNLRLRSDTADEVRVTGDPPTLARAVGNLLSNAVRLAPSGSTVYVSAGKSDERAWVKVTDEGPGIAPHERHRIFNRFYRGDASGADGAGASANTGLGLAIVRQIVESHGGSVTVDSVSGAGSTFTVWLPATSS
jgi:signal transduction histidine kinase